MSDIQHASHLFVIGAKGRVGRAVVRDAIQAGHHVTAYARDAKELAALTASEPTLRVAHGPANDEEALAAAMQGHDVVILAIGGKDPSTVQSIVSEGVRAATRAMQRAGIRRLISVGAAGLLPHPSGKLRGDVFLPPFLRGAFQDHKAAFSTILDSGLEWTVLCPPNMPDGERTGTYRIGIDDYPEGGQMISAADVAHLAVAALARPEYVHRRIGIAY